MVGKRRRGKGYEYKVCWKKTWLLERELGNAQELLREFKAKRQAQRGGRQGSVVVAYLVIMNIEEIFEKLQ